MLTQGIRIIHYQFQMKNIIVCLSPHSLIIIMLNLKFINYHYCQGQVTVFCMSHIIIAISSSENDWPIMNVQAVFL